ncbi:peptide-methionine (S)-S-oxide reductase MsrA [Pseudomonas psychrophila]|jgi:peptide-methionine (S)-S-oxide reductase|uniref:Peptide methionine sulfoxide reductase MsrA n=1 Tax=Pseudomonas psychrophila TaxID=122355 RepID=A0A8I1FUB8_9PSED|nr:peptide-methionine (S)-S-oxide reductase MsrA [Pseudomonas psychrophila]EPJ94123.1 methionine sulfoxide reductase A [Pseudomonas psychrophila]KAB0487118.1 peptide-methionine (S)-S-oxide reductase MsrA [Pseudomonas psychrophila]KMM97453.1 peptide methionine sulfoxide reductase [Pseudomonas psychrophila]KOX65903.1 peptide methionine sulfoxide reductase [Pseudomonas psychrophila]MBJ2258363.1 peptide-methionine (S)-S-oxide reductase MsrA [Pseudomonas psychrophila]
MVLRSEILVNKNVLPTKEQALPGRDTHVQLPETHYVTGEPLLGPFSKNVDFAIFGLGCFWGAERKFWEREGVVSTVVGYAGGYTPNPTYEEVCSGLTGHTEVVLVVYEPEIVSYKQLLAMFWELHNPTQGMRQGNDIGTQYRSVIYCTTPEQLDEALASKQVFQAELDKAGLGTITTEIEQAPTVYFAEAYHQQYLAKNPQGYCGIGGTGVTCPI